MGLYIKAACFAITDLQLVEIMKWVYTLLLPELLRFRSTTSRNYEVGLYSGICIGGAYRSTTSRNYEVGLYIQLITT